MADKVITYEPDNFLKKGYLSLFREILRELKQNRWLTCQLFKRDFSATYKQSLIGIVWTVIIPFASVGTFIVLNRAGVFASGAIKTPYPIYGILGMAFWQLFSTGLVSASNSLVKVGSMITKINFSKKSLVIASVGQALVSFLVQLFLAGILFACYRLAPNPAACLIPLLIIPLFLLTLGLGFMLSLLNGITRDVGNIVSVLMTFLMFLTPILYVKPEAGALAAFADYNPLYYLVTVPRDLVLQGTTAHWSGFLISSAVSLVIFLVCLVVFHLTETRVAERI